MEWLRIDIDIALFFTFVLVVLGGLHWAEIKTQNNQNLFKMRMEHYKTFYGLCNDILVRIKFYHPIDPNIDHEMMELEELAFDLDNYIDESKFLFDPNLYEFEHNFSQKVEEIFKKLYKGEVIPEADVNELIKIFGECKELIETYLGENRI